MQPEVTVVGSLNMDLIIRSPHLPQPGETIIGGVFHTAPGGKGANQAVAASRLGAKTAMVGRVGSDPFGDVLLGELAQAGVDHRFVDRDPETATGVAMIIVDDTGENSIVVASGANMCVTLADVEAAHAQIAAGDVLLLQLESPLGIVQRAAEIAQANRVKVILNPAPATDLPKELLALVDVLIPNETETALLTGSPARDIDEIQIAATTLLKQGPKTVIVTLGERGALLVGASGSEIIPTFEVIPVDTTAAGDAFVAGFAVALAEGKPLPEAVRWGNATGALATTQLGAQPSLPFRSQVAQFVAGQVS